jgi:hypothetical protein
LCQRYYEKSFAISVAPINGVNDDGVRYIMTAYSSSVGVITIILFKILKRIPPSIITYNTNNGSNSKWAFYNGSWNTAGTLNIIGATINGFGLEYFGLTATAYQSFMIQGNWTADAEL